jgi:hypothetical protein
MERSKNVPQFKARNAEMIRSETLSFRVDARLRFLSDLAARSQGRKLSNYVEQSLEQSLSNVLIEDEREPNTEIHERRYGRSLADLADQLWDANESTRFLNVVRIAPWLVSDGESNLLHFLRHSDYYAPGGLLSSLRIANDWEMLRPIADGTAGIDILPPDRWPSKALLFGLLGDKERIALYRKGKDEFQKQSNAYTKAMKARMQKR